MGATGKLRLPVAPECQVSLLQKSDFAPPRRKPGSRTAWNHWISAFAGMTMQVLLQGAQMFSAPHGNVSTGIDKGGQS